MSSFSKNILPRREHRERAQPALRVHKHGLLEKKKDYKLRANDRNRKRLRVKILQEKAAFRNPDEFYYAMINASTDAGTVNRVLNAKEKDVIPIASRDREQRLLAETQDSGYVQLKNNMERASLRRITDRLHFTAAAAAAPRTHIKFVDDESAEQQIVSVDRRTKTHDEHHSSAVDKAVAKEQRKAYKHFKRRQDRQQKLDAVLTDMRSAKNLMSKGRRFIVRRTDPETGAPPVYKWRRERRR